MLVFSTFSSARRFTRDNEPSNGEWFIKLGINGAYYVFDGYQQSIAREGVYVCVDCGHEFNPFWPPVPADYPSPDDVDHVPSSWCETCLFKKMDDED